MTIVGRQLNIAVTPGLVSLGTKDVVVSVPGVLLGDTIIVNLASGASLSTGISMEGGTATANDQVTIRFLTPIVVGVTLGTFNINIAWLR